MKLFETKIFTLYQEKLLFDEEGLKGKPQYSIDLELVKAYWDEETLTITLLKLNEAIEL